MSKVMKPTRTVKRLDVYTVKGIGTRDMGEHAGAPADMLRYDRAFKHIDPSGPLGTYVVFPTYSIKGSGTKKGEPTLGRWKSFITMLTKVTDPTLIDSVTYHIKTNPEAWITYVHTPTHELTPQTYSDFISEVTR